MEDIPSLLVLSSLAKLIERNKPTEEDDEDEVARLLEDNGDIERPPRSLYFSLPLLLLVPLFKDIDRSDKEEEEEDLSDPIVPFLCLLSCSVKKTFSSPDASLACNNKRSSCSSSSRISPSSSKLPMTGINSTSNKDIVVHLNTFCISIGKLSSLLSTVPLVTAPTSNQFINVPTIAPSSVYPCVLQLNKSKTLAQYSFSRLQPLPLPVNSDTEEDKAPTLNRADPGGNNTTETSSLLLSKGTATRTLLLLLRNGSHT